MNIKIDLSFFELLDCCIRLTLLLQVTRTILGIKTVSLIKTIFAVAPIPQPQPVILDLAF